MRGYRSFFWPAVLILVGVVALLVNTGHISIDRLYQLLYLWPLILIVIGLELIVRRTIHGPSADVAAALIVLLAIAGAAAYVTIAPNPAATSSRDFSGGIAGVTHGSVAIRAGAATITISAGGDLGADQYRAHIEFSGPAPTVTFDPGGLLNIDQSNNRSLFGIQDQKFVVNVQLNPDIPWSIGEKTGASNDTLQLGSLHMGSITLNTGASHDDLTLGPATGIVPVEIDGGALTVHIHRPSGTQATAEVSGGAVSLDFDGRTAHAIGKVSGETGDLGTDYYRIQISGGACTVTVDTRGAGSA